MRPRGSTGVGADILCRLLRIAGGAQGHIRILTYRSAYVKPVPALTRIRTRAGKGILLCLYDSPKSDLDTPPRAGLTPLPHRGVIEAAIGRTGRWTAMKRILAIALVGGGLVAAITAIRRKARNPEGDSELLQVDLERFEGEGGTPAVH